MKKIYLMLACALGLTAFKADAQCSNVLPGRYQDYIFQTVDVSSVRYSSVVTTDSMDIYEPHGDTATLRPVIILAHGGSFVQGSRRMNDVQTDVTIDSLCLRFARRGYVTVSIDYRLDASGGINMILSQASAADVVAKAISDGKAAIRYLSQNRTTYKIDTNNIFIGGNSAGAVLFMHVGYITNIAECSPVITTALNNNGGFDGNSGNPGYTTLAKGIVNLAGALSTVSLASHGDLPSVNCQGDIDDIVPFNCGKPLQNSCPDTLCGLGALEPQYQAMNIFHMSHVFPGQGHVPWSSDASMFKTVDSLTTVFLYNLVCTNVASVNEIHTNTEVSMFPNPATDVLNMNSKEQISEVVMYDQMGRVVAQVANINKLSYEVNTSHLPKGMYLVKVRFTNENNSPVVRRVAVQ